MIEIGTMQEKVANYIKNTFSKQFDILLNLGSESHSIDGYFPDIIFLSKQDKKVIFIIEIKKNGQVSNCLKYWEANMKNFSGTLYIVVPKLELESTKAIASLIDINVNFGYYNENESVIFE